jgi:hypothetical protein
VALQRENDLLASGLASLGLGGLGMSGLSHGNMSNGYNGSGNGDYNQGANGQNGKMLVGAVFCWLWGLLIPGLQRSNARGRKHCVLLQ